VAVFDMNLEAARRWWTSIKAAGGVAQAFKCDITDRAQKWTPLWLQPKPPWAPSPCW
jgi:hypothetical protein